MIATQFNFTWIVRSLPDCFVGKRQTSSGRRVGDQWESAGTGESLRARGVRPWHQLFKEEDI